MAKKRMVSNQIVDSDDFLDMPLSAQALYLHLLVRADDEGFLNSVKKVMRVIGAREDDLKVLMAKNFVITFDSGVLVIKHWLIHNTIRKDRLIPTAHTEEKNQLDIKDNKAYTLLSNKHKAIESQADDGHVTVTCQAADGIDKNRLDKYRLDKIRLDENREPKGSMSVETDPATSNDEIQTTKINFKDIANYWNQRSMLKEIKSMTDKRKDFIRVRVKNHGIDSIYTAIDNCRLSSFMKGDNNRNWHATFDWVFGKPQNFIKVLEGNYINQDHNPGRNDMQQRANKLKEKYGDATIDYDDQ